MRKPQLTVARFLILLLALLLAYVNPATAQTPQEPQTEECAPPSETKHVTQTSALDDEDEDGPQVPAAVLYAVRQCQLLLATMILAPDRFRTPTTRPTPRPDRVVPDDTPLPIVVRTPTVPTDRPGPPVDLGNPTPAATPEPSSLLTGLVGSSIALAGWLRRRRGKLANRGGVVEVEKEAEGELTARPS